MKWFHAIGICGKATSNVAKMFKDMGWFVTGSDLQYFPPVSIQLEKWNIPTVEGYNYEHLTKEFWSEKLGQDKASEIPDIPDLCLIIDTATPLNKEYLFAKKKGIDVRPYSQILGEYLVKEESIVVTGTAGKTTTTALVVRMLQEQGLDPSYMVGAEVIDFEQSLRNTKGRWSVLEGDEFHNREISNGAKFLEYKPKYLVITNIGWEHQDIFQTQDSYIYEFAKAVELVPEDGIIVAHAGDENINKALSGARCKVIRYGVDALGSWSIKKSGEWNAIFDDKGSLIMQFQTSLLGTYNLENILGAVALIKTILPAVDLDKIQYAIENFKGPKKRLEILHKDESFVVVDDFGVAPERAKNSLKTLKEYFSQYKIIAVFEPNSGSRIRDLETFNQLYKGTFKDAMEVIIPDLSTTNNELITAEELVSRLKVLGTNAIHVQSSELMNYLTELKNSNQKILFVFFSSYRLTEIAENLFK